MQKSRHRVVSGAGDGLIHVYDARKPKGAVYWPSLPDPGSEPLLTLGQASRALVAAMQAGAGDVALAEPRLQRAGAYQALGLNGSARAEANLVLQMSGVTDAQRRQALAALPPVAPVSLAGWAGLAELAELGSI